ncbi:MAG: hypothetical protein K6F36_02280 [Bacilli bacterium]|nr:hypothetical protein [Bacilli bacterium]
MRKIGVRQKSLLWAGLALFSLTLSAFVTSTIAWFNVSDFLTVGNIKVSCTNHDIRIGTRNSLGSIEFESDDMVSSDEQTFLTPVSSMFQDNSQYLDTLFPALSSEYPSVRGYGKTDVATSGFWQEEIFLTSDVGTYVYLDESTYVVANQRLNEIAATQTGLSVDDLNKVEDAVRVSFYSSDGYVIYEPNVEESSKTPLAGLLDVSFYDGYIDYNSSNEEVLYGEYNEDATLKYDDAVDHDVEHHEYDNAKPGVGGKTLAGIKHLNLEKSVNEGNLKIKEEETYALKDLLLKGSQYVCYIAPNEMKRLVVTIYLEGWDKECSNDLINSAFSAHIAFMGEHRTVAPNYPNY